jgi:hypothetical protein
VVKLREASEAGNAKAMLAEKPAAKSRERAAFRLLRNARGRIRASQEVLPAMPSAEIASFTGRFCRLLLCDKRRVIVKVDKVDLDRVVNAYLEFGVGHNHLFGLAHLVKSLT